MVFYGQTVDGILDRGYVLYITALVMVLVAALFVFARLASRMYAAQLGADDVTIGIALIASILLTATINMAVYHGYGRRSKDLSAEDADTAFMWFFIAQIPYKVALGFTKASIVLLYLRIFITKIFRVIAKIYLVVIVAWSIAAVLVTIFQCVPVSASWNKSIKNKTCVDKNQWWYAFASLNTATDCLIVLLPIRPILQLQLPKREKIGLFCVFGVGAFVCVTSIIRTVAVSQTSTGLDQSWDFIPRSTWTLVEANMGIICACLPMMRGPLGALFPRLFKGSTYGPSGNQSYGFQSYGLQSIDRQPRSLAVFHSPRTTQSEEEILGSAADNGAYFPPKEPKNVHISVTTEIQQSTSANLA